MMNLKSGTSLGTSKVITPGHYTNYTVDLPGARKANTTAREYRISALGRYLIAPQAITVKRRLVGCDIHWKSSAGSGVIPKFMRTWLEKRNGRREPMTLITEAPHSARRLSDSGLQSHIQGMEEKMRPFDALQQALSSIDISRVAKIVGICQDRVGGRSPLAISGDPAKQLSYIKTHAANDVAVKLERAHVADGLFELQGFDVKASALELSYRLIRLSHNGKSKACVVKDDHTVDFWLDDPKVIGYLQLFEYCLQSNHGMRESLGRCLKGNAQPMRLLFNQALAIDYGQAPLPAVYREIIEEKDKTSHLTQSIKQSLNRYQMGVSLNSVLQTGADDGVLCTDISILQEMRALEPIRERFPEVFEAVTQRASLSDAGRFYLLDSISGVDHDA